MKPLELVFTPKKALVRTELEIFEIELEDEENKLQLSIREDIEIPSSEDTNSTLLYVELSVDAAKAIANKIAEFILKNKD